MSAPRAESRQSVFLTVRVFEWGGEDGEEVIGVSATEEVAENVALSYQNYERTKKREKTWTGGRSTAFNVTEWEVRGV